LDITCESNEWDVVLVERGGSIVGSMPYMRSARLGFTTITHPPLTPRLGPWLRAAEGKYATRLAREKDIMEALIDGLPRFDFFSQAWSTALTNWLPFHWKGFTATTYYTYVLADLSNLDGVWSRFQENIRREIRKATGRAKLRMRPNATIDDLLALNRATFTRQQMALPYSETLVRSLEAACRNRECSRVLIAEDETGTAHAGALLVWDADACYYLIGGGDPTKRNSGAASLCIWEGIQHAARVGRHFDFEGSMMEPIERFFRGFGATQQPYFLVRRIDSPLMSLAYAWRGRRRRDARPPNAAEDKDKPE
jgi:hypothetical protein